MKFKNYLVIMLLLAAVNAAGTLSALELGAYVDGGIGESRLKAFYGMQYIMPYYSKYFKGLDGLFGAGFMLDTFADDGKLVMYRFQFGFEIFGYPQVPAWDSAKYNYTPPMGSVLTFRLCMKHTIGYAFFSSSLLRAWIGFRLTSYFPYYPDYSFSHPGQKLGFIFPGLFVPGLVIGLNFHLDERISLASEAGFNYEWTVPRKDQGYITSVNFHLAVGVLYRMSDDHPHMNIRLHEVSETGELPDTGK